MDCLPLMLIIDALEFLFLYIIMANHLFIIIFEDMSLLLSFCIFDIIGREARSFASGFQNCGGGSTIQIFYRQRSLLRALPCTLIH